MTKIEQPLPDHSPLGGSGAYRWLVCSGSVPLSNGVQDEESEFAAEGTVAHMLAEVSLKMGTDAWEEIGTTINDIEVTQEMADAVQVYLSDVRYRYPDRNQGNWFVEKKFHCPTIHPLFFGQGDNVYIDFEGRELHVHDYKHGAGIVVEVQRNPQMMYYGAGILEEMDLWKDIDKVTLHIAQPRGWHSDGPLRRWSITTEDLETWLDDELIPGMERALTSTDTVSGGHCRFCPARSRACPQLMADMKELEELMTQVVAKGGAAQLTSPQIGRFLTLYDTAKIVAKAAEKTAFSRLQAGKKVPGRKLAASRKNQAWKDDAEAQAKLVFGKEALTVPVLKSPAQIKALPGGEAFAAEHSFKPKGGLTVVASDDKRKTVSRDTTALFTDQTEKK